MNPEIPKSETQVSREELVAHLKTKTDEDLKWDAETKMMIHNWTTHELAAGKDRFDINTELYFICKEAGLDKESKEQFKKALSSFEI